MLLSDEWYLFFIHVFRNFPKLSSELHIKCLGPGLSKGCGPVDIESIKKHSMHYLQHSKKYFTEFKRKNKSS